MSLYSSGTWTSKQSCTQPLSGPHLVPSSWDALLCAGLSHLDPLHSVWKVTSEAIEELHQSLKSRPDESAMVEDPAGLKVSWDCHVSLHTQSSQRRALAMGSHVVEALVISGSSFLLTGMGKGSPFPWHMFVGAKGSIYRTSSCHSDIELLPE